MGTAVSGTGIPAPSLESTPRFSIKQSARSLWIGFILSIIVLAICVMVAIVRTKIRKRKLKSEYPNTTNSEMKQELIMEWGIYFLGGLLGVTTFAVNILALLPLFGV